MSQKDTESGETRNERFDITNSATNKDGVVETRGNLLKKVKYLGCVCVVCLLLVGITFAIMFATRPNRGAGAHFACPVAGETAYTGTEAYKTGQPSAAPLRGNVGCVDQGPLATRPKGKAGRTVLDASNIYGAMEAGFTKNQPGAACLAAGNNLPDFELRCRHEFG